MGTIVKNLIKIQSRILGLLVVLYIAIFSAPSYATLTLDSTEGTSLLIKGRRMAVFRLQFTASTQDEVLSSMKLACSDDHDGTISICFSNESNAIQSISLYNAASNTDTFDSTDTIVTGINSEHPIRVNFSSQFREVTLTDIDVPIANGVSDQFFLVLDIGPDAVVGATNTLTISSPGGLFAISADVDEDVVVTENATSLTFNTTQPNTVLPRGSSSNVAVLNISNGYTNTVAIKELHLSNTGGVEFGPSTSNITKAIVVGSDDATFGDADDIVLAQKSFTEATPNAALSFSHDITTGSTHRFFILYEVGTEVALGGSAELGIGTVVYDPDSILALNFAAISANVSAVSSTISGLSVQISTANFSHDFVLPGNKKVMSEIKIVPVGETANLESLTFHNTVRNFDAPGLASGNVGSEQGVISAQLYKRDTQASNESEVLTSTLVQTITNGVDSDLDVTFNVRDELTFSNISHTLNTGNDAFYYVVYEVGASTDITQEIGQSVKLQLPSAGIVAIGGSSGSSTSYFTALPTDNQVVVPIAGVSLVPDSLASIVPSDGIFGSGMTVPIFKFDIQTHQISVSMNSLEVGTTSTHIPFRSGSEENEVSKVFVYVDNTSDNGVFDGEPLDKKVAELDLASGRAITLSDKILIPTNNAETFYVVYELGGAIDADDSTDTTGNYNYYVDGFLVSANAVRGSSLIPISTVFPVIPDPQARADIRDVSLTLSEISELIPTVSVEGQLRVPVLSFALAADSDIPSISVEIVNTYGAFDRNNSGVNKVSLYWDQDNSQTVSEDDVFLGSSKTFLNSGQKTVVEGVSIESTSSYNVLVTYDIGQEAIGRNYDAQLNNIFMPSGNTSVLFAGGDLPSPTQTSPDVVVGNQVEVDAVVSETDAASLEVRNTSTPFEVEIGVVNNLTGSSVIIDKIYPRFYAGSSVDGRDITHEYSVTASPSNPSKTLTTGAAPVTFTFTVDPTNVYTEGTVFVDAYVDYFVTANTLQSIAVSNFIGDSESSYMAHLTRYQVSGGSWKSSTGETNPSLVLLVDRNVEDFLSISEATMVEKEEVERNGARVIFQAGDPIPKNGKMYITFSQPERVDESSISLQVGGVSYLKESQVVGENALTTTYYNFNAENGELYINDLGETDSSVVLSIQDIDGAQIVNQNGNNLEWSFIISESLRIEKFLFYPNPYSPQISTTLDITWLMTKDATVEIYIYDSTGRIVSRLDEQSFSAGYCSYEWDTQATFGKYIAAGIYIAKIVATDTDGNKVMSLGKLAVF